MKAKTRCPAGKKGYLYITQLITRQISPAASVRGEGGLPAPRTNQITKL